MKTLEVSGPIGIAPIGAVTISAVVALTFAIVIAILSANSRRFACDFLLGMLGAVLIGLILPTLGLPTSRTKMEGFVTATLGAVLAIGCPRLIAAVFLRRDR